MKPENIKSENEDLKHDVNHNVKEFIKEKQSFSEYNLIQ